MPATFWTQGIKPLQILTISARRQAEGEKLMDKSGESNASALHEILPGETSACGDQSSCDVVCGEQKSLRE